MNKETHYLISEKELALMKPTAYLVNTARGGVIKKKAVLAASAAVATLVEPSIRPPVGHLYRLPVPRYGAVLIGSG